MENVVGTEEGLPFTGGTEGCFLLLLLFSLFVCLFLSPSIFKLDCKTYAG